MKDLCGEMIEPQFIQYKYVHKVDDKPELVLYWIRNIFVIFENKLMY